MTISNPDEPLQVELLELYRKNESEFNAIYSELPDTQLLGPHLIALNGKYSVQKRRLLIIGQDIGTWSESSNDINLQMHAAKNFDVGRPNEKAPFWTLTRQLEKALDNEDHSCAWTNLSKYSDKGRRPTGLVEAYVATLDRILIEEIRILKPEICIFFTGPNFDVRLLHMFSGVSLKAVAPFTKHELAQLQHPILPAFSFRTYHPKFLRFKGKENDVVKSVVAACNSGEA